MRGSAGAAPVEVVQLQRAAADGALGIGWRHVGGFVSISELRRPLELVEKPLDGRVRPWHSVIGGLVPEMPFLPFLFAHKQNSNTLVSVLTS